MPKKGEDWGKLIVTKGFKKLPKIQNIAQSGHTGWDIDLVRISKDFNALGASVVQSGSDWKNNQLRDLFYDKPSQFTTKC